MVPMAEIISSLISKPPLKDLPSFTIVALFIRILLIIRAIRY